MGITSVQRYTLRRVLYILTAVLSVAGSGYAAVIAPLDSRLDQLEAKVADKSDAIARLSGQMDAIITYFRVPYPPLKDPLP
jgi:hypothetical protein